MEKVNLNQSKLILEKIIKKLLFESTQFSSLPNNFGLIINNDYLTLYDFKDDKIYGVVSLHEEKDFWYIGAIASEKGYGYELTKMAMSYVYPKPLMTDRDSSTTDAFMMILKKLRDEKLSDGVLDKSDQWYLLFKNKSDAYNELLNTKFKFNNQTVFRKLVDNANKIIENKPYLLDDINDRAFEFFSNKLNPN